MNTEKFYLDLSDELLWVIRRGGNSWYAGRNKKPVEELIKRLNVSHRPNVEVRNNNLYVCFNDHEKEEKCDWELVIENCISPFIP